MQFNTFNHAKLQMILDRPCSNNGEDEDEASPNDSELDQSRLEFDFNWEENMEFRDLVQNLPYEERFLGDILTNVSDVIENIPEGFERWLETTPLSVFFDNYLEHLDNWYAHEVMQRQGHPNSVEASEEIEESEEQNEHEPHEREENDEPGQLINEMNNDINPTSDNVATSEIVPKEKIGITNAALTTTDDNDSTSQDFQLTVVARKTETRKASAQDVEVKQVNIKQDNEVQQTVHPLLVTQGQTSSTTHQETSSQVSALQRTSAATLERHPRTRDVATQTIEPFLAYSIEEIIALLDELDKMYRSVDENQRILESVARVLEAHILELERAAEVQNYEYRPRHVMPVAHVRPVLRGRDCVPINGPTARECENSAIWSSILRNNMHNMLCHRFENLEENNGCDSQKENDLNVYGSISSDNNEEDDNNDGKGNENNDKGNDDSDKKDDDEQCIGSNCHFVGEGEEIDDDKNPLSSAPNEKNEVNERKVSDDKNTCNDVNSYASATNGNRTIKISALASKKGLKRERDERLRCYGGGFPSNDFKWDTDTTSTFPGFENSSSSAYIVNVSTAKTNTEQSFGELLCKRMNEMVEKPEVLMMDHNYDYYQYKLKSIENNSSNDHSNYNSIENSSGNSKYNSFNNSYDNSSENLSTTLVPGSPMPYHHQRPRLYQNTRAPQTSPQEVDSDQSIENLEHYEMYGQEVTGSSVEDYDSAAQHDSSYDSDPQKVIGLLDAAAYEGTDEGSPPPSYSGLFDNDGGKKAAPGAYHNGDQPSGPPPPPPPPPPPIIPPPPTSPPPVPSRPPTLFNGETQNQQQGCECVCCQVEYAYRLYHTHADDGCTDSDKQHRRAYCWMTPVRRVPQNGPNCGLAALCAAQPESSAVPFPTLTLSQAIPPLEINTLFRDARRRGMTGRGEMFSAKCLALLAQQHLSKWYSDIRLVREDLMAPAIMDGMSSNALVDSVTGDGGVPNLVARLIRGEIIAVCFDTDRNMEPSIRHGGRTAHWALLCGVLIVGTEEEAVRAQRVAFSERCMDDNRRPLASYAAADGSFCSSSSSSSVSSITESLDGVTTEQRTPNGSRVSTRNASRAEKRLCRDTAQMAAIEAMMEDEPAPEWDEKDKDGDHDNDNDVVHEQQAPWKPARVMVIARHGKKSKYALWPLSQLAHSNRQLKEPAEKIIHRLAPCSRFTPPDISGVSISAVPADSLNYGYCTVSDDQAEYDGDLELDDEDDDLEQSGLYVLPEGPRLDLCLARQYVVFVPKRSDEHDFQQHYQLHHDHEHDHCHHHHFNDYDEMLRKLATRWVLNEPPECLRRLVRREYQQQQQRQQQVQLPIRRSTRIFERMSNSLSDDYHCTVMGNTHSSSNAPTSNTTWFDEPLTPQYTPFSRRRNTAIRRQRSSKQQPQPQQQQQQQQQPFSTSTLRPAPRAPAVPKRPTTLCGTTPTTSANVTSAGASTAVTTTVVAPRQQLPPYRFAFEVGPAAVAAPAEFARAAFDSRASQYNSKKRKQ